MYNLQVLETCVKNCGAPFHQEVATKECMEFLKEQAVSTLGQCANMHMLYLW